jgi:hypothetical protein
MTKLVLPAGTHPALVKAVREVLRVFKPPPLDELPSPARVEFLKQKALNDAAERKKKRK